MATQEVVQTHNGILQHLRKCGCASTWRKHEHIRLREIRHAQSGKPVPLQLHDVLMAQVNGDQKKMVVVRLWGREEGVAGYGFSISVWGDKVLKINVVQQCEDQGTLHS